MTKEKNPIQLCSRCAVNEISNWVFENQLKLEPDTIKQIREEIQDIKLISGECIACGSRSVSDNCFERVLKVLEKSKASMDLKSEYQRLFGLHVVI